MRLRLSLVVFFGIAGLTTLFVQSSMANAAPEGAYDLSDATSSVLDRDSRSRCIPYPFRVVLTDGCI